MTQLAPELPVPAQWATVPVGARVLGPDGHPWVVTYVEQLSTVYAAPASDLSQSLSFPAQPEQWCVRLVPNEAYALAILRATFPNMIELDDWKDRDCANEARDRRT